MTIAKDFASKFAVAFVAIAMIFAAVAPVQAQESTEDLQKTINDLLAQVAALQGQMGDKGAAPSVGSCNFTMDLKTGSTGADVKALQQFLNSDPDTRVAASGVGSAGMETEYYGPATAAAVSKFQVKYRAEILSPAGLVNPTGFFGPGSRAQANKLCAGSDDGDDSDDDSDDSDEDTELSGEGQLDVFEIDDASDSDIEEGSEDAEVAEITLEATDGDIEITRMDIAVTNVADDPWEVFESFTLWVDGEMVGEVDASDEDEYLDEDAGEIRFSGLNIVAMEDEEVEITIAASVQSNLDTVPDTVNIAVTEVRYFDADGVADDDSTTDELGDTVSFDIEEEGEGEELTFSLGANNPDSTDIVVDEDDTTDEVTIMEYEIEAEEGDIEINELWVRLTTGTADVTEVVEDAYLVIDGETFDAEATTTSGGVTQDYKFDIDGDVVIDADETITVEVVVDLASTDDGSNYANSGETIKASVTSVLADLTDAEGADDLDATQISGSATGDTHNLVSEGIVVPADGVETTTDTSGDNDTLGEFTIEFEVTAVEGDFYIRELATGDADGITTATTGVEFMIEGASGTTTGTLSSTADEDTTGVFTVRDGETETFTLRVTHDPSSSGDVRVTLTGVNYSENTNGFYVTAGTDGNLYVPTPAQDFRTDYETVQGS
ncbi:MAG TPA: hypothetical protein VGE31_01250 [Candidatus Paceibacterota bacterium]